MKNGPSNILVSGSLAYDEVFIYEGEIRNHLPPSRDASLYVNLRAQGPFRRFGGCGGNTAYTLSLFGVQATLNSWLGEDGDRYLSYLLGLGVDVSNIPMLQDRATPAGALMVDRRGDHILFFGDPGRDLDLPLPDIDGLTLAVITAGVPGSMLGLLKSCREAAIPTLVDPGKIIMDVDAQALLRAIEGADTLVLNDYERDLLVRQSGISFKRIASSVGTVVITSGPEDITLHVGKNTVSIPPAKPREIKDPNGAGDAFLAGYSFGWLKGLIPEECIKIGSTAASFALEATGTQGHHFSTNLFSKRFEHAYGLSDFDFSTLPPNPYKIP